MRLHSKVSLVWVFFLAVLDARSAVLYVNLNSTNPLAPYTNWPTAARVIQDALDVASPADLILVTNGVYNTGGYVVYGSLTNRIALTRPMTLSSVNGPAVTFIQGYQIPGATNGDAAVRCAYLTNGAALLGFTLTNGATRVSGNPTNESTGGGVWCESTTAIVSNCVLTGNCASNYAGGAYQGTLLNCVLKQNSAVHGGGGTYYSNLGDCQLFNNAATALYVFPNSDGLGGGALYGSATNCTFAYNMASFGGGVAWTGVNGSLLVSNTASFNGGGAYQVNLLNCTVAGNFSSQYGGGTGNCRHTNSIIFNNTAPSGSNAYTGVFSHCCTASLPPLAFQGGKENFTNTPLFVNLTAGDFRLQSNSPCINGGDNAPVATATDLDGNPRIKGGTVDVGAYEFQNPASLLSYIWAQQYGFSTDGSADFADPDGDGMNNWQEWRCGTDPTNPLSVLKLLPPSKGSNGVAISWQSVSGINYFLLRNLALTRTASFSVLQSNIVGQAGTTTYLDSGANGSSAFVYRVGVQ